MLFIFKWDTVECLGILESRDKKQKSQEREDITKGDTSLRFPKQKVKNISFTETAEMRIRAGTNPIPHSKTQNHSFWCLSQAWLLDNHPSPRPML